MIMNNASKQNWKLQVYGMGVLAGAICGLVSAYLYSRAAEEDLNQLGAGKPAPMSTAQLIGLLLTTLGLVRQIAEAGKTKK